LPGGERGSAVRGEFDQLRYAVADDVLRTGQAARRNVAPISAVMSEDEIERRRRRFSFGTITMSAAIGWGWRS